MDKLGAMLTLSKAKDEYGFDAARAGLTAEEAADLASTFARFDRTGSGKLNSGDLYDLVGWRCKSSLFLTHELERRVRFQIVKKVN